MTSTTLTNASNTEELASSLPCPGFCCSDFNDPVFDPSRINQDTLPHFDLQNPIHPLFGRERFSNISDQEYCDIREALVLASRLLTVDSLSRYVMIMSRGELHKHRFNSDQMKRGRELTLAESTGTVFQIRSCDTENGFDQLLVYPRPDQRHVDQAMRVEAQQFWLNLAPLIEYCIDVKGWDEKGKLIMISEAAAGTCNPKEGPLCCIGLRNFPVGSASLIILKRHLIQRIHETAHCGEELNHSRAVLRLAQVLLHEIGHALQNAIFGRRPEEVVYQNSAHAEGGYDLENALFGGVIADTWFEVLPCHCLRRNSDSFHREALMMESWPSNRIARDYLGMENASFIDRKVPGKYTEFTLLPSDYASTICTEAFWSDRESYPLATKLRPASYPRWLFRRGGNAYEAELAVAAQEYGYEEEAVVALEAAAWTGREEEYDIERRLYVAEIDDPELDEVDVKRLGKIITRQRGYRDDREQIEDLMDISSWP